MREVENPSEAFMGEGARGAVGACVTPLLEGARPLLVELQALLGTTPGGSPRRTCVGFDSARVAMLLAVLDRHAGLFVSDQDVFVNVAGGIKITDPAADLALALALASSHKRVALPPGTLALGELGLTGSLRPAARLEARITEAGRLGFKRLLAPPARKRGAQAKRVETLAKQSGLQVLWCPTIAAALDQAF